MRYNLLLASLVIPLFAPAWLCAGPVLLSDQYSASELQPTKFVVVLDGISRDVLPERFPDGTSRLRCDLGDIADGAHTVKVKAVNSAVNPRAPLESADVILSFRKAGSLVERMKAESEKLPATRTPKGYLKEDH
ncbi:MAG TPA: hypothetical protein VMT71_14320 [Syntrophorhabdales bacterium]|nr:hypothetical protein [Syntrophorhabdales bacterium]